VVRTISKEKKRHTRSKEDPDPNVTGLRTILPIDSGTIDLILLIRLALLSSGGGIRTRRVIARQRLETSEALGLLVCTISAHARALADAFE
jgi:hypothetical protein